MVILHCWFCIHFEKNNLIFFETNNHQLFLTLSNMHALGKLKCDLISDFDVEKVFHKHVVDGSSFFFRDFLKQPNLEYDLRHDIATELNININEVVIIGSAKMGFSLKDTQFSEFDKGRKSDIDIAIINKQAFAEQTALIFELSRHFEKDWIKNYWQVNEFYSTPEKLRQRNIKSLFNAYVFYLAKGWLRVDFAPSRYVHPLKNSVGSWGTRLKRKVSIGFYSDWYYLKHYQMDNLLKLKAKIESLEI